MTTINLGMTKPAVGGDSDSWGAELNGDLDLLDGFAGRLMPQAEVSLASAATCDIGSAASTAVSITGTTTITSFGAVANCIRFVRFAGALTLTHNATGLVLLGGASHVTAAGDTAVYKSDASGNWRELAYSAAGFRPDLHTGTGAYVHATAPTLGSVSAASLALNGAAPGGNALAVSGAVQVSGNISSSGGSVSVPGGTLSPDTGGGGKITLTGWGTTGTISYNGSITTSDGNGIRMTCIANGVILNNSATSWASASDERLKTAIVPFSGALTKIGGIRAGTGRYLTESESVSRAFLSAQSVQAVLPEAVDADKDGMLSLRYDDVIPLLVAALQEQIVINDSLRARIGALEAR